MPLFDVANKVALITGAASGLGFRYAVKLLEEGARGVTLADIDKVAAAEALEHIQKAFGINKAIFVYCDVQRKSDLEEAFVKTIPEIPEYRYPNQQCWNIERSCLREGNCHQRQWGSLWRDPRTGQIHTPVQVGPRGSHRVCPGVTDTPLIQLMSGRNLGSVYQECLKILTNYPIQAPEHMANRMIQIIKSAPSGTMWIVEDNSLPFKFLLPNYQKMKRVYLDEDQ
ncbi:hypothetical protein GWI33_004102 [Rhynchophorus ferrugineus]|uniref:15-hydroxyprostaglandin dehydrogenase n=1 Tax=Rhynchophorus ferrugineus TaxID=354439 RepID=A0A834M2M0_RHYFE|nr:hypothetical protein GWI33_004102 [Rhynchophorus ferrugineus]